MMMLTGFGDTACSLVGINFTLIKLACQCQSCSWTSTYWKQSHQTVSCKCQWHL